MLFVFQWTVVSCMYYNLCSKSRVHYSFWFLFLLLFALVKIVYHFLCWSRIHSTFILTFLWRRTLALSLPTFFLVKENEFVFMCDPFNVHIQTIPQSIFTVYNCTLYAASTAWIFYFIQYKVLKMFSYLHLQARQQI